jgi:hypothetical protein
MESDYVVPQFLKALGCFWVVHPQQIDHLAEYPHLAVGTGSFGFLDRSSDQLLKYILIDNSIKHERPQKALCDFANQSSVAFKSSHINSVLLQLFSNWLAMRLRHHQERRAPFPQTRTDKQANSLVKLRFIRVWVHEMPAWLRMG